MKPRRAERAGANRCAAACSGGRRGGEVKKQGAVRFSCRAIKFTVKPHLGIRDHTVDR